jgi:ABC-type branched-subunit amino acid transport system ATPase component
LQIPLATPETRATRACGSLARTSDLRGAKILLIGPTGVGKTSLLRTLDPDRTLFVDVEAGDLSVQDLPVDTLRISDWPAARNLVPDLAATDSLRLISTGRAGIRNESLLTSTCPRQKVVKFLDVTPQ